MSDQWRSDVPISVPVVNPDLPDSISIPLQGFAFTPQGITFDLTQAVFEEIYAPVTYAEKPHG